ncbi:MAG: hypothetical protein GQ565_03040 [Candidatus Aegiribacteria sp.]|nr:hypothetical protein [Candidatus Aegiribacteria sp.]
MPLAEFHKDRSRPDGLCHRCKNCNKAWVKKHKRSPDKQFAYEMKYYYGLTPKDYTDMEHSQGGVCAICHRRPEKRLAVDHDHTTRKVRGLLCRTCNSAVGLLLDDPVIIKRAAEYIEDSRNGTRLDKRIIRGYWGPIHRV